MTSKTIFYRQAHPTFMAGDIPTSQVFTPTEKDKGLLSGYDGDLISASDSYKHYTETLKLASHSVWAVSKEEADTQGVPAIPDPKEDFKEHAAIDFRTHSERASRKVAKKLKEFAITRGIQHKG